MSKRSNAASRRMSLRTLCAELRKLREAGWKAYLDKPGDEDEPQWVRLHLPRSKREYCPLTALIRHRSGKWVEKSKAYEGSPLLGIDQELAATIVALADNRSDMPGFSSRARQRLLKAVGLIESLDETV